MNTAQMHRTYGATMHTMNAVKRCTKCGNEYPRTAEYFHRASVKDSKDGLKPRCKQCRLQDLRCQRTAGERREQAYHRNTAVALPEASTDYTRADALHLFVMIRHLHYGDCLICGDWTLERLDCQIISTVEDDNAPDGTLVTDSYADLLLYSGDSLVAVFEVRATRNTERRADTHRAIAEYLCKRGWIAHDTRRIEYGAVTAPDKCVSRVFRPLKTRRQAVQP